MFYNIVTVSRTRMWTSVGGRYSAYYQVIYSSSDAILINPSNWYFILASPSTDHVTQDWPIRHWGLNLGLSDPIMKNGRSTIISITEYAQKTPLVPVLWTFLVSFLPKVRFSSDFVRYLTFLPVDHLCVYVIRTGFCCLQPTTLRDSDSNRDKEGKQRKLQSLKIK